MKKQSPKSPIIAIIITAIGLAVAAPYSQAAGPTDQIPGQSTAQKARQAAALQAVHSSGPTTSGHANHYHTNKTTR